MLHLFPLRVHRQKWTITLYQTVFYDIKFCVNLGGAERLNCTLFCQSAFSNLYFWVERSNVSCKASGQFWVQMHRDATKLPSVQIPFPPWPRPCKGKERKGMEGGSLNGFSTIPSTKVFWSKGLNKSTNNRNRNNKYQNQHWIDWCVDLFEKEFFKENDWTVFTLFQQAGPIRILLHLRVQ